MLRNVIRFVMTGMLTVPLYLFLEVAFRNYMATDLDAHIGYMVLSLIGAALTGYVLAHFLLIGLERLTKLIRISFDNMSAQEMLSGLAGTVVGLVLALLLGNAIYKLPLVGPYIYVLVAFFFAYIGWMIGTRRREDFISIFPNFVSRGRGARQKSPQVQPMGIDKLVDTSVIIDGRIYDIAKSGFIDGSLVVPNFVLDELQKIADSSDSLKRNRGRSGLDVLGMMQKEDDIVVRIEESDYPEIHEVDAKLVKMGQDLGMPILTNDYNLNKVAQLQGVKVLNINELANALKPVVLPGEQFKVKIMKEGKEASQGIGYLDDGTMVVIENGKQLVGEIVNVEVTSVLQTAAGRMIFAKPR